ncbi:helix-turn-helix transcriptional regulator [Streptomyces sp. NPDC020875]|uniref:helix-turn-helix transcriptional regulator n=1 Tax=Streptomyces sp. NPDC020875 TaxID=3154898 RepID=UPI003406FE82
MARGLSDFDPAALRTHRTNADGDSTRESITADALARAVGATKAQILAYENGHRVPDPPRVRALAEALGIHPWQLMNTESRSSWTLADLRRAAGLRAQDVVERLEVSPKNYRRFETEGIVPSRRPRFVDDVAAALGMSRRTVERAVDRTPAVQRRQARAFELVLAMAERYVPRPGPWHGPTTTDDNLIELAAAYGRAPQRLRRVLAYELGELRRKFVRAQRERVIADYDADRKRQDGAREALYRWNEMYIRSLHRIPGRLERFHRTAQPSDVWQLLVDLNNTDATVRSDTGVWAVTVLLHRDPRVLPPHFVEQSAIDGVPVCRLSVPGAHHVAAFAGLYASLYPGVRRPSRTAARSGTKLRTPGAVGDTFALPGRTERIAVPQPFLEKARTVSAETKSIVSVGLSNRFVLMVGKQSLTALSAEELQSVDPMD